MYFSPHILVSLIFFRFILSCPQLHLTAVKIADRLLAALLFFLYAKIDHVGALNEACFKLYFYNVLKVQTFILSRQ